MVSFAARLTRAFFRHAQVPLTTGVEPQALATAKRRAATGANEVLAPRSGPAKPGWKDFVPARAADQKLNTFGTASRDHGLAPNRRPPIANYRSWALLALLGHHASA